MNNTISIKIITQEDVAAIFDSHADRLFEIVEDAFLKASKGEVLFPDKISQIFDTQTQNRINCMPATLLGNKVAGLKWVSVFPTNAPKGIQNVTGVMLLSEIETGFPIAVIDGTLCTQLRTAAVGCVAAKYLAPKKVETVGFIGAGEEARMHFTLLKHLFPSIRTCKVASRHSATEDRFIAEFDKIIPDVHFIACRGDNSQAVADTDIIVTAISGQAPVLKARDVRAGMLYIHKEGLLKDKDIYADLAEIIAGQKKGRESDEEFIYFNSVGLSYIDLNFAHEIYREASLLGLGRDIVLAESDRVDYRC